MLERLLAWFINNYIGEYFDNVNTDQLSIAYSEGEIELENLPLKHGALKNLGLPVEVKSAWIGKIRLRGSYRIRSEPWSITIEDLYLVSAPLSSFEYDAEKEELNAQNFKYGLLECLESKWKLHNKNVQEPSYYASSYWTWLTYSSSLVTSILENLQFNIKNVHLRYEETLPTGTPIACGFVIKSLSAYSSDQDWAPKFVNRTESSNVMRKVMQVEDIGLYWDSNVSFVSDFDEADRVHNMQTLLKSNILKDGSLSDHNYLISPVNGESFITRNFSDDEDEHSATKSKPRITFDFKIDQFVFTLSLRQYKQILYCVGEFNRMQTLWRNRKWRPQLPIKGNAKLWWKYAIDVNLQTWRNRSQRENWDFILNRARLITRYCKVYTDFLLQPDSMTEKMKHFKEEVETELDFDELFRLRDASCSTCRKQRNTEVAPPSPEIQTANPETWLLQNWVPTWLYIGSQQQSDDSVLSGVDDFFSSTDWEDLKFITMAAEIPKAICKIIDDFDPNGTEILNASLTEICLYQQIRGTEVDGNTRMVMSSEYYNRTTLSWEPLVEPWVFDLKWVIEMRKTKNGDISKVMQFRFYSHEVLSINLTSMSMDLYMRLNKFFEREAVKSARHEERCKIVCDRVLANYQVDLSFKSLNLRLLKASLVMGVPHEALGLATINDFNFNSLLNEKEITISGSIGRIQMVEAFHRIAKDNRPVLTIGETYKSDPPNGMSSSSQMSDSRALSLVFNRSYADNIMDVTFRMASLYYFHSTKLVTEFVFWSSKCKSDMSVLASKIKHTAYEVAKEIVTKVVPVPSDMKPFSNYNKLGLEKRRGLNIAFQNKIQSSIRDFRIEFHIESPMIVFPCSPQAVSDLKKLFSNEPGNGLKRTPSTANASELLKHVTVGVEIKRGTLKIIDDFDGAEVPLLEFKWPELSLWHKMRGSEVKGNTKIIFATNYFNRILSGWEPLIENWKFDLNWVVTMKKWTKDGIVQRTSCENSSNSKKFEFNFCSYDILNINVTSTLIDLYKRVRSYWDKKNEGLVPEGDFLFSDGGLNGSLNLMDFEESLLPEPMLSPPSSWVPSVSAPDIELQVILDAHGIGLSIVNKHNEELLYSSLRAILLEYCYTTAKHSFNCSVRDLQIDNQLQEAQKPVVIYPKKLHPRDPMGAQPALSISIQKLVVPSVKAHFFHEVQIKFKDIVFNLEELVLLKMYDFFGYSATDMRSRAASEVLTSHRAIRASLANSVWVYLTLLEIDLRKVTLTVSTTSPLPTELVSLKKSLGLSLIAFEGAKVQLEKFKRQNSLDTFKFLMNEIVEHYRMQLENQAAKILISVDFLGNPLGLVNNVSEGLSEFITKGNFGGLVTNITHGLSNSTAKFMSTLSDSLDLATMDNRHQEIRRRIKKDNADHIRTGLRGLGVGIMGGMTSILTHTYEGATNEGLQGLVSGFGRGLIGTITKPTVGVLDFATEAASAVRDTSKKILLHGPPVQRVRLPRVCLGASGLLPLYDPRQAEGQQFFYRSSNAEMDDDENFISFEIILPDTACLITTEKVRFLTWGHQSANHGEIFLSASFEDIIKCKAEVNELNSHTETLLVLSVIRESSVASYTKQGNLIDLRTKTLKVRCSSDRVARQTCEQVNCAKAAYEMKKYKLM